MSHAWWYLARSAGIVAWAMLTASVLWGIVLATDLFPESRRPAWLLDLHRWLGGLTVAFMAIHLVALVGDSYTHFGVKEILVPFTSSWRPLAVALGVLAMWSLVAVEATSLAMKRLPRKVWKYVHMASYATFVMVAFHGALAGTDATQPMYVWSSVAAIALVMMATLYRVLRRGAPKRRKSSSASRSQPAPAGRQRVIRQPAPTTQASPFAGPPAGPSAGQVPPSAHPAPPPWPPAGQPAGPPAGGKYHVPAPGAPTSGPQ